MRNEGRVSRCRDCEENVCEGASLVLPTDTALVGLSVSAHLNSRVLIPVSSGNLQEHSLADAKV